MQNIVGQYVRRSEDARSNLLRARRSAEGRSPLSPLIREALNQKILQTTHANAYILQVVTRREVMPQKTKLSIPIERVFLNQNLSENEG